MDSNAIFSIANAIRTKNHAKSTFSISTSILSYILSSLKALEEPTSTSFQNNANRIKLIRDLQFLRNFIEQLDSLKLYNDSPEVTTTDLTIFNNLHSLELCNVHIGTITGLGKLRSQLRKIISQKGTSTLKEILECESQVHTWFDLKEASFTRSNIQVLDDGLQYVPLLQTLDLSHNKLENVEIVSVLTNLKHLNLSYNKLTSVPVLSGQICYRLQNLILNNNFIAKLAGLGNLTNISVLDLSNNCICLHKTLIALAQLATLQWLGLDGNPLSYHPLHRTKTLNYLHSNTASVNFILDNVNVSKTERKQIGVHRFRPNVCENTLEQTISSRVRKVRHVVIAENAEKQDNTPILSSTPREHLETKKQIEDLRQEYGENWLNSHSGMLVQSVLGLETSQPLSQSPYDVDFLIHSEDFHKEVDKCEEVSEEVSEEAEALTPEPEEIEIEDDDSLQGEESLYLVNIEGENDPIFVAITDKHICEKECLTSKERARWHIDSITDCKTDGNIVQIDYETMRKDRKERRYVFEEDQQQFVDLLHKKMETRQPKQEDGKLQCMRCMTIFANLPNGTLLGDATAISCPSCDSNLVVEHIS